MLPRIIPRHENDKITELCRLVDENHAAILALDYIPLHGVDGLSPEHKKGLQHGLAYKMYTPEDVFYAQKKYEAFHRA